MPLVSIKKLIPFLVILLFASFQLRWLDAVPGSLPDAEELEFHLARASAYQQALEQAQLPPRWASGFNYELGYPIFNFHYPLPNWIMVTLATVSNDVIWQFQVMHLLIFTLGGLGATLYFLTKSIKLAPATLLGLIYIASPYWLYDVYVRSNPGELLVLMLLPWVFLTIQRLSQAKTQTALNINQLLFSFALALLLLAHNITGILGFGLVLAYIGLKYRKHLKRYIQPMVIALLLVAWFWIPALAEKHWTNLDADLANRDLSRSTRSWQALLNIPPQTNYQFNPQAESVTVQLGYALILAALVLIVLILRQKQPVSRTELFWLMTFLGLAWLMSDWSRLFWSNITLVNFIQFPFRLAVLTTFVGTIMAGYLIRRSSYWIYLLVGAAGFNLLFVYQPKTYLPINQTFLESYPLTTTAAHELDPPWYHLSQALAMDMSESVVASGSANVEITKETGYELEFLVSATESATIIVRRLYFPGWQALADDQMIDLHRYKYDQAGLINFPIEAGDHLIQVRFTQQTPARILGNGLSSFGLGVLLVSLVKIVTNRRVRKKLE